MVYLHRLQNLVICCYLKPELTAITLHNQGQLLNASTVNNVKSHFNDSNDDFTIEQPPKDVDVWGR
jgi:hypothetical protein